LHHLFLVGNRYMKRAGHVRETAFQNSVVCRFFTCRHRRLPALVSGNGPGVHPGGGGFDGGHAGGAGGGVLPAEVSMEVTRAVEAEVEAMWQVRVPVEVR